jgi:hypothetical protein
VIGRTFCRRNSGFIFDRGGFLRSRHGGIEDLILVVGEVFAVCEEDGSEEVL